METHDRIVALAAEHSGIDRPIGPLTPVGEGGLELDSLDKVQFTLLLEEEFGIEISDEETDRPELGTIGGLVEFVQDKLDAKPAATLVHCQGANAAVQRITRNDDLKLEFTDIEFNVGGISTTGTLTDAMATATVDLRDQDIEEVAERGRAELTNSGVLGVVPRFTTSTDIEPFLESTEPSKADLASLSAVAIMAAETARCHAKRIFEAGWHARNEHGQLIEDAWQTFARDNGFKP